MMESNVRELNANRLFFALILENWVLDFGRPIANHLISSPIIYPGVGDYFHILYNIITAFLLLNLLDKTEEKFNKNVKYLVVILFLLGASIHLVGDSVQTRLVKFGYNLSLSVYQNPIMMPLPSYFKDFFELLYFFDEYLGHYLWYLAYLTAFMLFFNCSVTANTSYSKFSIKNIGGFKEIALAIFGGIYFFYTAIEGQVYPLFILSYLFMIIKIITLGKEKTLNKEGKFLFLMFTCTIFILALWVLKFQSVPEFWEIYQKYFMK